ncbi:hypothetical protein CMV_014813 [Castanea mollissima]|uniref:Uncharacterized protein n=1 Tax=Castanea mollissima TaxID=60419 RepID=A0A8J4R674_9ROSI|nr:hypothetical protein CMV_014813 [Castanea mollissima]
MDRYGLKDFHIQKIRDELLEGKSFSVELDWVSRHCNAVANSFAAIGSDVQFAKEGEADLSGFLLEKEFYAMNYPKWRGEGFFEFFDVESYRIWDKDTGFPKGFKEILLRTFRNRVIIPSDIHGRPTSFEIPEFNIVDPIGKQFLDLIHVIARLISNEEISSILSQFCCEEEDTPKEEYLIDVNYIQKARKSSNNLFNFLESIQVHLTQTSLPFKKGGAESVCLVQKRWKYFGSFCFQIKMSTNFQESDEDLNRFKAYQDSISKLPLVSYDGYQLHLRASGERNQNFYELLGTIAVGGDFG